jgi:hypothetical protein
MRLVLFAAALVVMSSAHAQAPRGCDTREFRELDFWVGDWDLTYGDGKKGRNRITKILDGCVILEEFSGAPGVALDGKSFSTFDRTAGRWKQTWVDSSGAYLDFIGSTDGGHQVFSREAATRDGRKFVQRMIFLDVKPESLTWLWQRSDDGGKSWKTMWEIKYERVKAEGRG